MFASQKLEVVDAQQTVNQAVAVGNVASATSAGASLSFTSRQATSGAVASDAHTAVTGSSGDYAGLTSSATGNTATAAACCGGLSGTSVQTTGDKAVEATGVLSVHAPTGQLSADTIAVGNTQGWIAQNGSIAQSTEQTLSGSVRADTTANAGLVTGEAGSSATAVGNDVTLQGTASTVEGLTTQTVTGGEIRATLTSQQQAGDQIAGQATASGNNVTVMNDGAYTTNDHVQSNAAAVTADAAYGVGGWNAASVGAYGVGNSVYVDSASPKTEIGIDQTNTGAVTAKSSLLTGGLGGDAYVNATAVGNAAQGYACSTCEGGVGGQQQPGERRLREGGRRVPRHLRRRDHGRLQRGGQHRHLLGQERRLRDRGRLSAARTRRDRQPMVSGRRRRPGTSWS